MVNQFDMQKYKRRPQNVVTAGGFVKANQPGMGLASAMKNHNEMMRQPNKNEDNSSKYSSIQPNSNRDLFLPQTGHMHLRQGDKAVHLMPAGQSMNHLQKSNIDEISDIDIEFKIEDDEDRLRLAECNFKEIETLVGKLPFQHWTINRSIISQQLNALSGENAQDAKQMRKEMIRDQVTKQVDLDALYPWIVTYNPVMT